MNRSPVRTVHVRPLVSYTTFVLIDHDADYSRAASARQPDGTGLVKLWDEGLLLHSHGNDFRPSVVLNSWPQAVPAPDGEWDVSGPHAIRLSSGRLKVRNLLEWDDSEPLSLPTDGGYWIRTARRGQPEEATEYGDFGPEDVLEEWTIDLWPAADGEAPPPAPRRGRLPASARE
ncbi:hypothetical protein [Streptantibioticus silvisoli]|uniref:Uncharacterized protein n=1 Tax=Streptantibioticus silvisoli TaxID=2705255 RepID=A0ABT6VSY6_9ACTN|nr:hypothetical protein [Streptantibioticus silvisoli]MDI5961589.1 hypothetical protein [Streptantibioticus silvisoli]